MPIFEMRCPDCSTENTDRIYDVLVTSSDIDKELKCPDCGAVLIKQISTPNFRIA